MQNTIKKSLIIILSAITFFAFVIAVYMFLQNEKTSPKEMAIKNVYISGAKFTDPASIKTIVGDLNNIYIENIDTDILKSYLQELPFVKNVKIVKQYPNEIVIKITDKNIKFINENEYPLDENFSVINQKISNEILHNSLIKIYGTPNKEKTDTLFQELDKLPFIKKRITDIILVSNRRWDIVINVYGNNILLRLPENNIAKTVTTFFKKIYKSNILKGKISVIDLRSNKIIIK